MSKTLTTIVLAAGKGTRMKSAKAKVLHEVFFAPMVHHVLDALDPLEPKQNVVVVGHQKDAVAESLATFPVTFATQTEQLGTGHAVLAAEPYVENGKGTVMIICGDTPLILTETLQAMVSQHEESGAVLTLMTTILDDPTNYGRVLSTDTGSIARIVEEKDASFEQKTEKEINAGIYCVDQEFLFSTLKDVGTDNSQGEVYLTDIVAMAVEQGLLADKFVNPVPEHVLGVNSRVELSQAHQELAQRRNRQLMMEGVTIHQPATVTVEPSVIVEKDAVLEPGVTLKGKTKVGEGSVVGQGAILTDSTVGSSSVIGAYAYLVNQTVTAGQIVKPHSVLED